jgi:hypothetical protein
VARLQAADVKNDMVSPTEGTGEMSEILSPEEFAAILWPGMFKLGWRDQDPTSAFFQAECYCLEKATEMLKTIEVRRKAEEKAK